jgi:hypothetical protein
MFPKRSRILKIQLVDVCETQPFLSQAKEASAVAGQCI